MGDYQSGMHIILLKYLQGIRALGGGLFVPVNLLMILMD